ncbi:hypothetical protein MMC11_000448 [Xylographa trunciseda]|nr:hypothetical protein [Xylographa trunciseda]
MGMGDQDVSNFTPPSSHRLPTVSASEALRTLSTSHSLVVSTGLPQLDHILQGKDFQSPSQEPFSGGLARGQITEVYGPPGVGKTTFAIQGAANVLHTGDSVVWIDTGKPIVGSRLKDVISDLSLASYQDTLTSFPQTRSPSELLKRLHYFFTPTLPHLLALVAHLSPSFPPEDTSLIVVDAVSPLFATAFPRAVEGLDNNQASGKKNEALQWAASRRFSVMSDFLARLAKLAAMKNIAILLISQTTTKVKTEYGAVLRPALSTRAWDAGIHNRIVLFRDWEATHDQQGRENRTKAIRFAGVVKIANVAYEGLGKVVSFTIEQSGLKEIAIPRNTSPSTVLPMLQGPTLKRKREVVADSQSEEEDVGSDDEFGWAGEDSLEIEGLNDDQGHVPEEELPTSRNEE